MKAPPASLESLDIDVIDRFCNQTSIVNLVGSSGLERDINVRMDGSRVDRFVSDYVNPRTTPTRAGVATQLLLEKVSPNLPGFKIV
jgi:hypothetical protein